jgi:hypothetical protein
MKANNESIGAICKTFQGSGSTVMTNYYIKWSKIIASRMPKASTIMPLAPTESPDDSPAKD